MNRQELISSLDGFLDNGAYSKTLERLVSVPTVSSDDLGHELMLTFLGDALGPIFSDMGFQWQILENSAEHGGPFLMAERHEEPTRPTVLSYGHADVIEGMAEDWTEGRSPFQLSETENCIFGRGTADNKGQLLLNLMAMQEVLKARKGKLGFNCKFLIETSEEIGSPGLEVFVDENSYRLSADVLIASDGPRVKAEVPTLVLGLRGVLNFSLEISARSCPHHSGNWGGIIADPGILMAHVLAAICSPSGVINVPAWRPQSLADKDRRALAGCVFDPGSSEDVPDEDWGEPNLETWEKLALWPSFSVLAIDHGDPSNPVNAIQPKCTVHCGLRFPASLDAGSFLDGLQDYLIAQGFTQVAIVHAADSAFIPATKGDPEGYWASFVATSIERSVARRPQVLPSNGGSLPNHVFAKKLGLETIWIPHSYNACNQHAPDEHIRKDILKNAMKIMTGLWWDVGDLYNNR